MTDLTPFSPDQWVRIDLKAMRSSNRSCVTAGYPSDNYLAQVERLVKEHGPWGIVTRTFPPGYGLTVMVGDQGQMFSMKGHSWCHPLTVEDEVERSSMIRAKQRKADNITFVHNLTNSVTQELVAKIESGAIPDTWDGHELRQLLADKFVREASSLMREPRSRRMKDYRNTVIVNNL